MAVGQLWTFPPLRTLVERFGESLLYEFPESPGVYLFCDRDEGGRYVGEANHLRRLASYCAANRERFARRFIQLLNEVMRIEFDTCVDERAAMLRAELLIEGLSPKFNRVEKL